MLKIILLVIAAAAVVFVGWSIQEPLAKLLTGKYRVAPSSSVSSKPSHSSKSSSAASSKGSSSGSKTDAALRGIFLPKSVLSDPSSLASTLSSAKQAGINLAVVELKGEDGVVGYATQVAEAQGTPIIAQGAPDASAAAKAIAAAGMTPAAKISCFKDPVAPLAIHGSSVLYSGDHTINWLDQSNQRWLNPYSTVAQQYIVDLAKEAVTLGYKQIYLDNLEFPTNTGKAWFGDNLPSKESALTSFVQSITQQINAAGGKVSVVYPGEAAIGQGTADAGQDQALYGYASDYYTPNLCPSQFPDGTAVGSTTVSKADLTPDATVAAAASALKQLAGDKLSKTLPYVQAYTDTALGDGNYKQYTADDINAEIKALSDAGIHNYILYAPDGKYTLSGVKAAQ